MNPEVFDRFDRECSEKLSGEIDKILTAGKGKELCAIGFITTDDFYGFYLTWEHGKSIDEYYDWKNSLNPDFLYQPLTDIVDSCDDIDLCNPSDEKWEFAQALLAVLEKNIKNLPDEIFSGNGFKRENVVFFATMCDGDYVREMLELSVKMFNNADAVDSYRRPAE